MNDSEILQMILSELKDMKQDISELKQGQSELKQGQSELQQGQSELQQGQQDTSKRLERVEVQAAKTAVIIENEIATNIALLQEGHGDIVQKLKDLEGLPKMVNEIQSDVSVIKKVVASHSQDIQELKAQ